MFWHSYFWDITDFWPRKLNYYEPKTKNIMKICKQIVGAGNVKRILNKNKSHDLQWNQDHICIITNIISNIYADNTL